MRYLFATCLSFVCLLAHAKTDTNLNFYSEPNNFSKPVRILTESYGDLDNDGIPEKVVVLDSGLQGLSGMGNGRDLLIYKKNSGEESWYLWHTSRGPILDDNTGGLMGDPFESLSINRGTIVITHFGGSRDKWNYTHRYRYQNNDWYLIGSTVYHGATCDKFMTFDYNLSTGKAIYKQGVDWYKEVCSEEDKNWAKPLNKTLSLPITSLPLMDKFVPGINKIKLTSGINRDIYY